MNNKFEDILKKYHFYNQQYEYCITHYRSRIYIFTSIVIKVKRNICWLSIIPNSFNIHYSQTLEQSLNIINTVIDYKHGYQIIIRKNDKYIWTIQKRENKLNNKYNKITFLNLQNIIIKRKILENLFKIPFLYITYNYTDSDDNYINMVGHAFLSKKYVIYDVDHTNFIVDNYKIENYFISDIEILYRY